MGIIEESFSRLFPETEFNFITSLSYSGKFKPYNATVRKIGSRLYFSLSRSWEGVSEEIVVGLVQHLLVKVLKKRMASTFNMQLYDDFIKGVSEVAEVDSGSSDEMLESSFNRVNEKYFFSLVDKPNLQWGNGSFRRLASYDYHTNTITVSRLFSAIGVPERLLDYLMYHEMLHKKLKFSSSNGRVRHHGAEFRRLEREFDGAGEIEQELDGFIRSSRIRQRRKRVFGWRQLLMLR